MTERVCMDCGGRFPVDLARAHAGPRPDRCPRCSAARASRVVTLYGTVHFDSEGNATAVADDGRGFSVRWDHAYAVSEGDHILLDFDPAAPREPGKLPRCLHLRLRVEAVRQSAEPSPWPAKCSSCSWTRRSTTWAKARAAERAHAASHLEAATS